MIDFIKRLLGFSAKPVEAAPEANQVAPYKVSEPAATTPIPLVVEAVAPAKAKAPAKAVTKAPAKPRATKAKPQA